MCGKKVPSLPRVWDASVAQSAARRGDLPLPVFLMVHVICYWAWKETEYVQGNELKKNVQCCYIVSYACAWLFGRQTDGRSLSLSTQDIHKTTWLFQDALPGATQELDALEPCLLLESWWLFCICVEVYNKYFLYTLHPHIYSVLHVYLKVIFVYIVFLPFVCVGLPQVLSGADRTGSSHQPSTGHGFQHGGAHPYLQCHHPKVLWNQQSPDNSNRRARHPPPVVELRTRGAVAFITHEVAAPTTKEEDLCVSTVAVLMKQRRKEKLALFGFCFLLRHHSLWPATRGFCVCKFCSTSPRWRCTQKLYLSLYIIYLHKPIFYDAN